MGSGLLSVIFLAWIHFFANQAKVLGWIWHGRFLSFASGISFAYVFIHLLPTLEKGQPILKNTFGKLVPYLDMHTYLIALFGVLFYYGIHTQSTSGLKRYFYVSVLGSILFNFFVGASLSDSSNPDIQPLLLFTIAMGMHYFVQDHNTTTANEGLFESRVRWWLVAALFAGYAAEKVIHIPDSIVTIAVSFLAGGIFLNALRYELPKREQVGYLFFVAGSLIYTAILLGLGK